VLSLITATEAAITHQIAAPAAFLHGLPISLTTPQIPLEIAARFAPASDLRAAHRLTKLVPSAAITHAHGLRAGWIAALAHHIRPFPFLLTAHNIAEGGTLTRLAVKTIAQRAKAIIAVSQAVADSLVTLGAPPEKIIVISNGVDTEHFAHLPTQADARRSLGLAPNTYTLGCIARLSPEKGVDTLIQAAAALPDMRVIIAGDGPQRNTLQAALPPNVSLLGRIPDTRALLSAVNALVIPSRMEGQGIVALEAMAAHVPIIASRVGGLAEMLSENDTALLIPPANPDALVRAITRLRADPALQEHLTHTAARLVRTRYALPRTVAAIADVYAAVAASMPVRPPQP